MNRSRLVVVAGALALAACEGGGGAAPGEVSNGVPPVRFRGDATATAVHFVSNVQAACKSAGLKVIPGTEAQACAVIGKTRKEIIVTNPCKASGKYAKDLCHELGHVNGWPYDHGK